MQFLGRYFGQQTADDRVIRDAFYEFLCPEMGRQPLLLTLGARVSLSSQVLETSMPP